MLHSIPAVRTGEIAGFTQDHLDDMGNNGDDAEYSDEVYYQLVCVQAASTTATTLSLM